MPPRHRRGAGMSCLAGKRDPMPFDTGQRRHHAHGMITLLQHRPLFDVDLAEAQHSLGVTGQARDCLGVASKVA